MSTPLCDTCIHKNICNLKKDYLDILNSCELEISNRGKEFSLNLVCAHYLVEKPEILFRNMNIPEDRVIKDTPRI